MKRIVLTGSESTGKTTLAVHLGARYGAIVVPEFVRAYAAEKDGPLAFADHGPIARGQIAAEDDGVRRATARGDALLVQDTDLLSTMVYCAHYYGACPPWIADEAARRRPDLYLLMDIDLPWVADPQRDRGDRREEMQALFRDAVARSGAPWRVVEGAGDERMLNAASAIDAILSPPLPG